MRKLAIIFGTGRNGSTLLSRLIDGNPDIYMHPIEANFFAAINDIVEFGYVRNSTALNVSDRPLEYLDKEVSLLKLIDYYSFHEEEIKKDYLSRVDEEYEYGPYWKDYLISHCSKNIKAEEFLQEFLYAFSKWLNPDRDFKFYCFKTIEVQYISDYRERFYDAKFIHIIRHPIDFFGSQKRTMEKNKTLPRHYFSGDNLFSMIQKRWIPHAEYILSIDEGVVEKNCVVKYEELIDSPDNVFSKIISFYQVELHESFKKQTILNGYLPKNLPVNSSELGVETPIEVSAKLKKKISNILSDKDECYIFFFCDLFLRRLNYRQDASKVVTVLGLLKVDVDEFIHIKDCKSFFKAFVFFFIRRFWYLKEYNFLKRRGYNVKS